MRRTSGASAGEAEVTGRAGSGSRTAGISEGEVRAIGMVEVQGLVQQYGFRPVLRGLDLHVEAGQIVVVLGANGAGKTTLLRVLASLARPTRGSVRVAGCHLPRQAALARRRIGVVLHQSLLYGDLTVEENLRFYGRLYGVEPLASRIDHLLDLVGLKNRRTDLVRTLSRGMQQRLAIARAVLHRPPLLLLDEPYTGLDPEAVASLDGLLRESVGRGCAVVMTSHEPTHAVRLEARVDVLADGVIARSVEGGHAESLLPAAGRNLVSG